MKIAVIDNYDSFTYNLVHYFEAFDVTVTVKRNDAFDIEELEAFDRIVLSPGPGLPKDAGLMMKVIDRYHQSKPMMGVCLGHQALAEYFGDSLYNMDEIYHGMSSVISVDKEHYLFEGMDSEVEVGRYHSWAVKDLSKHWDIIAKGVDEDVVMAMEHKEFPLIGIQFHPESVMTPQGKQMIKNWLDHTY